MQGDIIAIPDRFGNHASDPGRDPFRIVAGLIVLPVKVHFQRIDLPLIFGSNPLRVLQRLIAVTILQKIFFFLSCNPEVTDQKDSGVSGRCAALLKDIAGSLKRVSDRCIVSVLRGLRDHLLAGIPLLDGGNVGKRKRNTDIIRILLRRIGILSVIRAEFNHGNPGIFRRQHIDEHHSRRGSETIRVRSCHGSGIIQNKHEINGRIIFPRRCRQFGIRVLFLQNRGNFSVRSFLLCERCEIVGKALLPSECRKVVGKALLHSKCREITGKAFLLSECRGRFTLSPVPCRFRKSCLRQNQAENP